MQLWHWTVYAELDSVCKIVSADLMFCTFHLFFVAQHCAFIATTNARQKRAGALPFDGDLLVPEIYVACTCSAGCKWGPGTAVIITAGPGSACSTYSKQRVLLG